MKIVATDIYDRYRRGLADPDFVPLASGVDIGLALVELEPGFDGEISYEHVEIEALSAEAAQGLYIEVSGYPYQMATVVGGREKMETCDSKMYFHEGQIVGVVSTDDEGHAVVHYNVDATNG